MAFGNFRGLSIAVPVPATALDLNTGIIALPVPSGSIQASNLGTSTLEALRHSGVADRVESEGRRPHFHYELAVKVRRFESLVDSGRTLADVELEAVLRTASDGNPLWTKVYHQQIASRQGDMHALADAMQQALGQIFERLTGDLKATATDDD